MAAPVPIIRSVSGAFDYQRAQKVWNVHEGLALLRLHSNFHFALYRLSATWRFKNPLTVDGRISFTTLRQMIRDKNVDDHFTLRHSVKHAVSKS